MLKKSYIILIVSVICLSIGYGTAHGECGSGNCSPDTYQSLCKIKEFMYLASGESFDYDACINDYVTSCLEEYKECKEEEEQEEPWYGCFIHNIR